MFDISIVTKPTAAEKFHSRWRYTAYITSFPPPHLVTSRRSPLRPAGIVSRSSHVRSLALFYTVCGFYADDLPAQSQTRQPPRAITAANTSSTASAEFYATLAGGHLGRQHSDVCVVTVLKLLSFGSLTPRVAVLNGQSGGEKANRRTTLLIFRVTLSNRLAMEHLQSKKMSTPSP